MSISSIIKSISSGRTNSVFAKANPNKGANFKKLSNMLLNNNPVPAFNNTVGVPNRFSNVNAAKHNIGSLYQDVSHANTTLSKDELSNAKHNTIRNAIASKKLKPNINESYSPAGTGVGIAPRILEKKPNVTITPNISSYKQMDTKSIPTNGTSNGVPKTLVSGGYIKAPEKNTNKNTTNITNNSVNATNNSSTDRSNNSSKNITNNSVNATNNSSLDRSNNSSKNITNNSVNATNNSSTDRSNNSVNATNNSSLDRSNNSSKNITNNSSLDRSNNSVNATNNSVNAADKVSELADNLDSNKPKGSTTASPSKDKLDLSSISSPIEQLVNETKEYSGKFKLLNEEQKKQTALLKTISVSLDKSGSGGLIESASDIFNKKRGRGLPSRIARGAKNLAKRALPFVKNNLGKIGQGAKAALSATSSIARAAATSGLASNTTMAAGRLLARATPIGMAVATGATVGNAIGSKIYEKYQDTDFMKGVGEKVAKVAAFFGNDEAKQAVSDTANYKSKAALSEQAKVNKANVQKEMTAQGMSKTAQAAVLGNLEVESGFQTKSENTNYSNSSNDRIRKIFKTKTKGMSDAELTALKKDPVAFADKMYAHLGGHKFRGRGLVQLTGKDNYAKYSQQLFKDDRLVKNPDLANDPAIAAKIAVAYTKDRAGAVAKKRFGKDLNDLSYDQASNAVTQSVAGEGNDLSKGIHAEFAAKKNAAGRKYLSEPTTDTKVAATDKSKTEAKIDKQTPSKPGEGTVLAKTPSKPGEGTVLAKTPASKPGEGTVLAKTPAAKPGEGTILATKAPAAKSGEGTVLAKAPAKPGEGTILATKAPAAKSGEGTVLAKEDKSANKTVTKTKTSKSTATATYAKSSEGSTLALKEAAESINKGNLSTSPTLVPTNSTLNAGSKSLSDDLIAALAPKLQTVSAANIKPSTNAESLTTAYASSNSNSQPPQPVQMASNTPPAGQLKAPATSGGPTQSGNTAKGGSSKDGAAGKDSTEKENAIMAVRNISSTIQRVFDKDFQLGV